tara:strand:- start:363 stop:1040 length:678 start_codon:yes stop_codon:yes gene_type:complete
MIGASDTRQLGMTLPELIVAISVTVVISTVIVNFMIDNIRTSSAQSARQSLLGSARITLDKVTNDIRHSAAADDNNRWNDPHSPGAPGNQLSWQSNANTLVLATAAKNTSGDIIFDDPSNYITAKNNYVYFVQNGILYKRIIASPVANNAAKTTCPEASSSPSCPKDTVVVRDVKSFSVAYINADNTSVTPSSARAVELTLTLEDKVFGESVNASYKTRMVFRNG